MLELRPRDAEVRRVDTRRLQLRLRLRDVHAGDEALIVPGAGELERAREGVDGFVQEPPLRVQALQEEPVGGQLRVQGEPHGFEVDGAMLRIAAVIWVERDSQKAIVIGKGGERLKAISTGARIGMTDAA